MFANCLKPSDGVKRIFNFIHILYSKTRVTRNVKIIYVAKSIKPKINTVLYIYHYIISIYCFTLFYNFISM